jgi:hypothetical protein
MKGLYSMVLIGQCWYERQNQIPILKISNPTAIEYKIAYQEQDL